MGQRNGFKISTGASSILLIFIVLCLTTFAVLSYITANADYKLTQKSSDNIKKYYAADSYAQDVISRLDTELRYLNTASKEIVNQNFSEWDKIGISENIQADIYDVFVMETLTAEEQQKKIYSILMDNYKFLSGETKAVPEISKDASSDIYRYISFNITISDTHDLEVVLRTQALQDSSSKPYTISKYTMVSTLETEIDDEYQEFWPGE